MIIAILLVFGLALGSFVNALVWRVHEQAQELDRKKPNKQYLTELSINKGRSMCPNCKHTLAAKDLIPVLSWLSTDGKCRYCRKPISWQYPVVELTTMALFLISYLCWPEPLHGAQTVIFGIWLLIVAGLMALLVYDARWYLLPNRILYPTGLLAAVMAIVEISSSNNVGRTALDMVLAVLVGGGIFYVLYQASKGKWIGGGDVKLGWVLGLIAGTPALSMMIIFIASFSGVLVSLPFLQAKRLKKDSTIPFGPFLIIGAIVVQLFGQSILKWYQVTFLGY